MHQWFRQFDVTASYGNLKAAGLLQPIKQVIGKLPGDKN